MHNHFQIIATALLTWVFCSFAGSFAASAQADHVAHYQAYNTALEQGDMTTAIDQAEKAWRAAEENLGNNPTTAVLAYNFANLIYYSQPEAAVEPLNRVIAITGEDSDMFGVETPKLMLFLVNALLEDYSRAMRNKLKTTLDDFEIASTPSNLLHARAWTYILTYDFQRKHYERAQQSVEHIRRHYDGYDAIYPREVASAYITGAISYVAGRKRTEQDFIDATDLFRDAIELFPPQTSIDSFDPLLAIAIAWHGASNSAGLSDYLISRWRNRGRMDRRPPSLNSIGGVKWASKPPRASLCRFEWSTNGDPEYPESSRLKGIMGAALVGYHIEENKVKNARLLAEIPEQSTLGEISLNSMSSWVLLNEVPDYCLNDNLFLFQFTLY